MFFLALLFACGNETTAASSAPPPAENSEVANILAGLQSGETPDPTPTDQEPPAVPEEVTERAPPEPAAGSASSGRTDSPACKAARSERESHQAKIDSYREKDVVAAEARWLQAEEAKNWCAGDLAGCATDGEKFKEYNIAAQVAQKAYEDAQFRVGELEAAFYNIDQEIQAACGTSRQ